MVEKTYWMVDLCTLYTSSWISVYRNKLFMSRLLLEVHIVTWQSLERGLFGANSWDCFLVGVGDFTLLNKP